MADVKTHLRELSVATTVGLLIKGTKFTQKDFYDSKKFFSSAKDIIESNIEIANNITEPPIEKLNATL